jgi:hypothetical protein
MVSSQWQSMSTDHSENRFLFKLDAAAANTAAPTPPPLVWLLQPRRPLAVARVPPRLNTASLPTPFVPLPAARLKLPLCPLGARRSHSKPPELLRFIFPKIRGSDPDQDSIRSVDPDPYSESRSRSRRAKIINKSSKKLRNFMLMKCWTFSFES